MGGKRRRSITAQDGSLWWLPAQRAASKHSLWALPWPGCGPLGHSHQLLIRGTDNKSTHSIRLGPSEMMAAEEQSSLQWVRKELHKGIHSPALRRKPCSRAIPLRFHSSQISNCSSINSLQPPGKAQTPPISAA